MFSPILFFNRRFAMSSVLWKSVAAALLLLGVLAFAQQSAKAAIIASDDFESYTVGSSLVGGNGGTGWTTVWGDVAPTTAAITSVSELTNQAMQIQPTSGTTWNNAGERGFTTQTGPVYIGFDLKTDAAWTSNFLQFYFNALSYSTTNNHEDAFSVGLSNLANPTSYFVRKGGATEGTNMTTATGGSYVSGDAHSLVIKLSKSSGLAGDNYDEITLWVDPTSESDAPTASLLLAANPGNANLGSSLSYFHVRLSSVTNNASSDRLYIDNLVIADSFASVVPEPSSCVTVCFGSILTLAAKRRQRRHMS
jgi:hypothetical protein